MHVLVLLVAVMLGIFDFWYHAQSLDLTQLVWEPTAAEEQQHITHPGLEFQSQLSMYSNI